MSHYLIYLSEIFNKNLEQLNLITQTLNKMGTFRPADFNVFVLETTEEHQTVHNAIRSHAPQNSKFFVATVEDISFQGGFQFGSTLALLEGRKAPEGFNRPIEYPNNGIV